MIQAVALIIFFTFSALCATAYVRWMFGYWQRKKVPFIQPHFPMGNFEPPWGIKNGIYKTVFHLYSKLKSSGHKYGGFFSMLRPVFMPIDLDLLKNIMIKDFQHFVDRGAYYNEVDDPLSAHLFSIEGEKWRHLRMKTSPTFTSGKMKAMFHLVLRCGDDLKKEIKKLWENNQPVDVKEVGALFTTNVIANCAFGLDTNCFEDPNNEFRRYAKDFLKGDAQQMARFLITQAFPNLCRKLGVRFFPAYWTDFFYDVVNKVVQHRESTNSARNDFVDLLLEVKRAGEGNESLTMDEFAAQCFLFFLAGFETSSSTMTFAFFEMAKNQHVQDEVRKEIRHILEKHDAKVTYDAIMEMTYMQQVFDETLRKYPIVGTLDRIVTKEYRIPGEDIVLEKGTKVTIALQAIQNDPEYYPDPAKFDPERFSPENKAKRHPCAYMPFGEGPRNCLGIRFGIMQAKVGMTIMLKDYKYTLVDTTPQLVLQPTSPFLSPMGKVLLNIEKVN